MSALGGAVIRASVPRLTLDAAFEQKNDIAKAVEEELEKAMPAYGLEIVQTLIVDIEPDTHVKRAMNEINAGTVATVQCPPSNLSLCANQLVLKVTIHCFSGNTAFSRVIFKPHLILKLCVSPASTDEDERSKIVVCRCSNRRRRMKMTEVMLSCVTTLIFYLCLQ
ncbi:hypothetical protein DM860_013791 [Cuscuta australis]|uniref:Band 7 domain-containing protein n=1 Tax=Cuscuta australis TaxID=267555 RepID=A0A328DHX6_9ASTE|nr:hypothetical protein DM860_013791 [Cuscuta australis]